MRRRSLWKDWPALQAEMARADRIALFLDYDGTLVPIAEHPSKARLPAATRRLLRGLLGCREIWTALVSGRSLQDLKERVGLRGLCYVGNHGLELEGDKLRHVNPAAQKSRSVLAKIGQELKSVLRPIRGAWVEDKGFTLAVHYRQVGPAEKLLVQNLFHGAVRPYVQRGQARATGGKEVLEVRPPVRWTKGTVVQWLLARQQAAHAGRRLLPIYLGDDLTDEDAFAALQGKGLTIAVGPSNPLTHALYTIRSPSEVQRFLRFLLDARRPAATS